MRMPQHRRTPPTRGSVVESILYTIDDPVRMAEGAKVAFLADLRFRHGRDGELRRLYTSFGMIEVLSRLVDTVGTVGQRHERILTKGLRSPIEQHPVNAFPMPTFQYVSVRAHLPFVTGDQLRATSRPGCCLEVEELQLAVPPSSRSTFPAKI